jgi:hypothetical protein
MIWNYFDHEHIVGTHCDHYRHVRILAEADQWCFSQRNATLPFVPIKSWAAQFSYLISENRMRSFHFGPLGLLLEQDFYFEDIEPEGCRVTVASRIKVPRFLGWLQPRFHRLMRRWFYSVWTEDMEMRERRLKVWQLGFRDFVGLDYVNQKTEGPAGSRSALSSSIAGPENHGDCAHWHLATAPARQKTRLRAAGVDDRAARQKLKRSLAARRANSTDASGVHRV